MNQEEAAAEALRLNREAGQKRTTDGSFWLEEEVEPGVWEAVNQQDDKSWWQKLLTVIPLGS